MAFTYVTVTRRYLTAAGTPAKGTVSFDPTGQMVNGETTIDAPWRGELDAEGDLNVVLAANDDPATTPTGVTYRVDERIEGQPRRSYVVEIPYDAEDNAVDLSTLQELDVPPAYVAPVPIAISSVTGLQGELAALEESIGEGGVPDGAVTNAKVAADAAISQSKIAGLPGALALRGVMRRPEDFGAVGDGEADDTEALEDLLAAVQPGETIWLEPGQIYTHDSVLTLTAAGVRILGGGEVQATEEDTSAFVVTGDYVTIDGPAFTCPVTTQRWDTLTHQKLQLQNNVGCVIRNVTVDGSAAAGIFTYGASHFLIENCFVTNTRADAFHNVKGSHHGLIIGCEALDVGDDFFAAVSYASGVDAGKTHHIRFIGCKGVNTTHGRMFACAGADDVEFIGCYGDGSHAGGIIVVAETSYDSYGSARVVFRDIEIRNANSVGEDRPDHGAVIVSCEDEGKVIEDVVVRNIRITNTDVEASRQLSIIANDGDVDGIVYDDIVYAGTGPDLPLYTNVDPSKYTATNIRRGGWGWELLASKRLAAPADTSGVITFSPRRQLMVVVRINGCDAPDIPALIFNETEDNYWTRFLTVPAGSATLTNVETDAGTMLRLSGLTSQGLRQHTAMIANHPGWPKVATISSGVESGSADAGAIEIPGTGSWHVTTEQISSIELVMAGGADMNDNTEILIFGSETF